MTADLSPNTNKDENVLMDSKVCQSIRQRVTGLMDLSTELRQRIFSDVLRSATADMLKRREKAKEVVDHFVEETKAASDNNALRTLLATVDTDLLKKQFREASTGQGNMVPQELENLKGLNFQLRAEMEYVEEKFWLGLTEEEAVADKITREQWRETLRRGLHPDVAVLFKVDGKSL